MTGGRPEPDQSSSVSPQALATCAKCGACTAVCPVYQVTGRETLTARGRLHLLSKLSGPEVDSQLTEIFSKCLLCGACRKVCPRGIDIPALIIAARASMPQVSGFSSFKKFLAQQALARPGLLAALSQAARPFGLLPGLPEESGLRLRLSAPLPDLSQLAEGYTPTPGETKPTPTNAALYFSGCLSRHLAPAIGLASEALLEKLCGFRLLAPDQQGCCGLAAKAAGDLGQARRLARRTIALYSSDECRGLPIFTSCASCFAGLKEYPALLKNDPDWCAQAQAFADRVWEFSSFILQHRLPPADQFRPGPPAHTIVYHDPCHLRFAGITAPPRDLLRQAPGLKVLELPHGPQCCGMGGLFHIAHADLAHAIRQRVLDDFLATGAEMVVSTCSGCLLHWQQGLAALEPPARATHLAILLARQFDCQTRP